MPPATIGERDKLVTIQRGVQTKGTSHLPVTSWNDLAPLTAYMRRIDASGSERLTSAQLQASVDSEWEMPYVAAMDPELVDVPKLRRLVYAGRTFNIQRAVLRDAPEGKQIRLWTLARSG